MVKIRKKRIFEDEVQNQQQNQSPVETPEQKAAKERLEKVNKVLEQLKNIYWAISNNVPAEIQKSIPEFKTGNKEAEPAIKAWDAFKANPNEQTYKTFIEAFKNYGIASSQTKEEVNQSAVNTQQQVESMSNSFGSRLNEKLKEKTKQSFYNNALEVGFFEPQMKF